MNETENGIVCWNDACPECGERHVDNLVWQNPNEGEAKVKVKCQCCGHVYVPGDMTKYTVCHEMDDEPTYIIDRSQRGGDGEWLDIVTFDASIPVDLRRRLAEIVKRELERG